MKNKISEITISILVIILGIFMLVWAGKVMDIVSQLIGVLLLIYGAFNIYAIFKNNYNRPYNATAAAIKIVVALVLIIKPSILSEIISFIIGIFILLSSISTLTIAIKSKNNVNYNVTLGLSITGIIIGILCIVGKFLIPNIIIQFLGLMLIVYGIVNLIDCLLLNKSVIEVKNTKIIDVKED